MSPPIHPVSPIEVEDEPGDIQIFDIGLGKVAKGQSQLRFNSEGIYTARETAVLVRCALVDTVHGPFSTTDTTPHTLLVFDFQLDYIKTTRTIHEAMITLVIGGVKRIHQIAPQKRISFDPQEQTIKVTKGGKGELGIDYGAKLTGGGNLEKEVEAVRIKYATARGWTQHYPKRGPNDKTPHNCVNWSIIENPAKKDEGVPPHFRAAVLLERDGNERVQLEMAIDSTADLLTGIEDFGRKLMGGVPKGELEINPEDQSTHRLKDYSTTALGAEDLNEIAQLSLGSLADKLFH